MSATAWILAPTAPLLLTVFAITFGLAAGLWSALAPLVVAETHPEQLASILGLLFTAPAVGGALGPLLGGVLIGVTPGSTLGLLIAACFLTAHRILLPLDHDRLADVGSRAASHPDAVPTRPAPSIRLGGRP